MPTTLTGLLLFVVLLIPGIAYVAARDRSCPEQRTSPFRETGMVVGVSVLAELAVLAVFAMIRIWWPHATPDVGELVRDPGSYLRGDQHHRGHYASVVLWFVGLMLAATVLAILPGIGRIRSVFGGPHPSTASAWWLLLEDAPSKTPHQFVQVNCSLADGSYIEGRTGAFNKSGDETQDRDLVLVAPLKYRPAGAAQAETYPANAVCISARQIVAMFITIVNPATPTTAAAGPGSAAVAPAPARQQAGAEVAAPATPSSSTNPSAPSPATP